MAVARAMCQIQAIIILPSTQSTIRSYNVLVVLYHDRNMTNQLIARDPARRDQKYRDVVLKKHIHMRNSKIVSFLRDTKLNYHKTSFQCSVWLQSGT